MGTRDVELPGKCDEVSLELPASLPFEDWLEVGERLWAERQRLHFFIGDWLNFGEMHFGEMYSQVMDETKFSYGSLANDKWISAHVAPERRRVGLSFAHHAEVAGLSPELQCLWLDRAEREHLTREEFREALRPVKKGIKQEAWSVIVTLFSQDETRELLDELQARGLQCRMK